MVEEILIDSDNITLERLDRYFTQRRERKEHGKKNAQDHFFEMFCQIMQSIDDENAELAPPSDDVQQALRLITNRLDALDRKIPPPKESTPRTEQFAKERCQTMAKYIWKLHPDMTQVEMARHEAVFNLSITGGKGYTVDTVKNWIADVDPRPAEKKRGRPRKAKK